MFGSKSEFEARNYKSDQTSIKIYYLPSNPSVNFPFERCDLKKLGFSGAAVYIVIDVVCLVIFFLIVILPIFAKKKAPRQTSSKAAQTQAQTQTQAAMFCPNCVKSLADSANFCQYCGARIK